MQVGDLVRHVAKDSGFNTGIVLEVDVNIWQEQVIPSSVKVLWAGLDDPDVIYLDELEKISETT